MKKYSLGFALFSFFFISQKINAQVIIQIDAGSRSPFGNIQSLIIQANGKCAYYFSTVQGELRDSTSFVFSKAQTDSLLSQAERLGFFGLQKEYKKGVDGAGIFISINKAGKKKSVSLINSDVPEINAWVMLLNEMLKDRNIYINYGQKSPSKN